MSELLMIRHGQASFGDDNYDRLSPIGIQQSKVVARHLTALGKSFDAVYCGTMERQIKTAQELYKHGEDMKANLPELLQLTSFDEYDSLTVWEALIPQMIEEDPSTKEDLKQIYTDKKSFQKLFEKVMYRWISGSFNRPRVPAWSDFKKRVGQGIKEIMHHHGAKKHLIIFTSGGPISVAIQLALGITDQKTMDMSWQIMNASITRFKYNALGIALAGFNDIAHLELEQDKKLLTYR
ncbi:MAG: histidine phosphatase family protein [Desulfobacterales bacterium]|jgi:broad specificity phosphatase PhoE